MLDKFIQAIHNKHKINVHFFSKEAGTVVSRICAPMDYGPSRKFRDGLDRYHVWDYFPPNCKKPHPIPLLPSQIQSFDLLDEPFDPSEFVKWTVISWHVPRDWGQFS